LVIRYDVVQDVSDAYGYTDERKPRFMPTPRDVSNMLTVWGWLNDLRRQAGTGRRDYKLLVSRARGASWVKLAARFGTYEKRVARWRDGAVFWIYLKNQHAVEQMEK
jgi:hypothetical protein